MVPAAPLSLAHTPGAAPEPLSFLPRHIVPLLTPPGLLSLLPSLSRDRPCLALRPGRLRVFLGAPAGLPHPSCRAQRTRLSAGGYRSRAPSRRATATDRAHLLSRQGGDARPGRLSPHALAARSGGGAAAPQAALDRGGGGRGPAGRHPSLRCAPPQTGAAPSATGRSLRCSAFEPPAVARATPRSRQRLSRELPAPARQHSVLFGSPSATLGSARLCSAPARQHSAPLGRQGRPRARRRGGAGAGRAEERRAEGPSRPGRRLRGAPLPRCPEVPAPGPRPSRGSRSVSLGSPLSGRRGSPGAGLGPAPSRRPSPFGGAAGGGHGRILLLPRAPPHGLSTAHAVPPVPAFSPAGRAVGPPRGGQSPVGLRPGVTERHKLPDPERKKPKGPPSGRTPRREQPPQRSAAQRSGAAQPAAGQAAPGRGSPRWGG